VQDVSERWNGRGSLVSLSRTLCAGDSRGDHGTTGSSSELAKGFNVRKGRLLLHGSFDGIEGKFVVNLDVRA